MEQIGRGGSSKVYRVASRDMKIFAMKVVPTQDLDNSTMQGYLNEINILKRLRKKENIIQYIDSEFNVQKNILYLV